MPHGPTAAVPPAAAQDYEAMATAARCRLSSGRAYDPDDVY